MEKKLKNKIESNILQNENAILLQHYLKVNFEAGGDRTKSMHPIKVCEKKLHATMLATIFIMNFRTIPLPVYSMGENVNIRFEFRIFVVSGFVSKY